MVTKNNLEKSTNATINNLVPVFWSVIVILLSGSPYQTIFSKFYIVTLTIGLLSFFLALPTLLKPIGRTQIALFTFTIMALFTMITHLEFTRQFYFRFLCTVFIAYYLCQKFTFDQIAKVFIKIMLWVTIMSFVGYFLANNTSILNVFPKFINSNGVEYRIGFVFNYIIEIPERNCGIFWEPGIFATYLILALSFEIIRKPSQRINFIHVIIFVIGLFTVNSTAGYLLGVICILLFFVTKLGKRKIGIVPSIISLFFLAMFLIVLFNLDIIIMNSFLINNRYIAKLLTSNLENSARITVISHNLKMFMKSPLSGQGIVEISRNMITFADISTPTYILSMFGILGLSLTWYIFRGVFRQRNINVYVKLVFTGILIAIISKEPHLEILFTWILIFGLLKDKTALGDI